MRLLREYAASSIAVLLGHVFARGSITFAAIVVARYFPAQDFAAYSYFQISASSLATLASFGLGTSAARHFALISRGESGDGFPFGVLWACGVVAPIFAALLVLVVPEAWLGAGPMSSRLVIAGGVLSILLTVVPAGAMIGLQLYVQSVWTSCFSALVLFSVLIVGVVRDSLMLAIVALILGFFAQAAGDAVCVIRKLGIRFLRKTMTFNGRSLGRILDFAGPMFLVSVLNAGALWMTARIVRSADSSQVAFAIFSIGMQWFALVLVLPGVLTKVSLPLLVRAGFEGNRAKVADMGVLLAFLSSVAGGLVILIGLPVVEHLYGHRYEITWLTILPFLMAALFNAPAGVSGNLIVVSGRQWAWLWITFAASLSGLLVAWLLRSHGAMGGGGAIFANSLVLAICGHLYGRVRLADSQESGHLQ